MPLTSAQLTTLKADIAADSALNSQPMNADGHATVAAAYNLTASPDWTVWKTGIPVKDVKGQIVWSEMIALTVAQRETFLFMLSNGTLNAADANIQAGLLAIWSAGTTTRTQLVALAKRLARRGEKLFSTGTGSTASPASMTFEGLITTTDVESARNLA